MSDLDREKAVFQPDKIEQGDRSTLSQENEGFRSTILGIMQKLEDQGRTKEADFFRIGLLAALKQLWKNIQAEDHTKNLRELWLDYYRQHQPEIGDEFLLGMTEIIKQLNETENRAVAAEAAAVRDVLTGLFNRRKFNQDLQVFINRYEMERKDFCLVLFDVDGLKTVNDTYGHPVGDDVLRFFAKVLTNSIRADVGDLAYRWGGDEFTLLLPVNETVAQTIVNRVFKNLEQLNINTKNQRDTGSLMFDLSASSGLIVASKMIGELTVRNMEKDVDKLLYRMKKRR